MTTNRPKRIAVQVSDDLHETMMRLSAATGQSASSIVNEMIMSALPQFETVLRAIEHAKEGNRQSAMDVMAGLLMDAGFVLEEAQQDFKELRMKPEKDKP